MKTLLSILCCSIIYLASHTAHAQKYFAIGPKAAFSVNRFEDLRNDDNITFESFQTISAGAFARLNLGRLYVQPEIYFLVKGANYNLVGNVQETGKIRINTFEAPVLLGYYLVRTDAFNIRAIAGPVFNLYTKETENDLKVLDPNRYNFDRNVNSVQLGLGADILMFSLDARYEYGLSRLNRESGVRANQFIINLGYKLFER
ncbi:porin family protein [Cesiribacter sp. SM1]|uniref:porin family protein n=1 Tax=Cesiribacter sp. SM1 TaxID=2861196 RepID=UPI001CD3F6EA|nr:porin family protein [Cesiribacter sp. SM1]